MKYFTDETDFKGNMHKMDPKLLDMLDTLRETYGHPIILLFSVYLLEINKSHFFFLKISILEFNSAGS